MTITAIRLSYALGATVDVIIGVLLLLPVTLARALGLAEAPTRLSERVALGMAAALLFGWTGVLLWAARSPVERRGVLLLTIFPVIAGLALAVLFAWTGSLVSTAGAAIVWTMQGVLVGLFAWTYHAAWRIAGNRRTR
jgi:hypothetical protein